MRWLWIIVLIAMALPAAVPLKTRRSKPSPRIYGDEVHTNQISTSSYHVRQNIVDIHNYYRTKVDPPAANMLKMKWHYGLGRAAQRWASQCPGLVHDSAAGLHIDGFGTSGQNIFITTERTLWKFAIRMWFSEYKDFTYGANENNFSSIGHYTQMVWASTFLVGCGVSYCPGHTGPLGRDYYMYVCNYAPTGNFANSLSRPYVAGEPCSMCRNHCTGGKLCTNPCYHNDEWSNCADLKKTMPTWTCYTDSEEGRKRRKSCGATCNCQDKIYFHHG